MSDLVAWRSGDFLNQPISFLLCASPRWRGASAQPKRKALVPWIRSVSPWATAEATQTCWRTTNGDGVTTCTQKAKRDDTHTPAVQTAIRTCVLHPCMKTAIISKRANYCTITACRLEATCCRCSLSARQMAAVEPINSTRSWRSRQQTHSTIDHGSMHIIAEYLTLKSEFSFYFIRFLTFSDIFSVRIYLFSLRILMQISQFS